MWYVVNEFLQFVHLNSVLVSLDIIQILSQEFATEGSPISLLPLKHIIILTEKIVSYHPHVIDTASELLRNKKLFALPETEITPDYIRSIRRSLSIIPYFLSLYNKPFVVSD